jgi:hypothetical protein
MKLCGRWLSVLWVTATLLWPLYPTASRAASGDSGQWKSSEAGGLPIIGDLAPSSEKQTREWADTDDTPQHHDPMLLGGKPNRVAPTDAGFSTHFRVERVARSTPSVGRPLSRGPPVRV